MRRHIAQTSRSPRPANDNFWTRRRAKRAAAGIFPSSSMPSATAASGGCYHVTAERVTHWRCDALCARYSATGNASLGCLDTQLTSGGTTAILRRARDALSRSLPREDGIAQMRELDSFAITRDGCPLTAKNDGRHYHGLDPLKLRVLAEGIVNALEGTNERRIEARRNTRSARPKE